MDRETGKKGVTLAGVMLFGKDDVISNINPYCRTDALYRVDDLDRYDDRDFVETNLIEMYDRLIDFISKYTMDRFALDENSRRVSPRTFPTASIPSRSNPSPTATRTPSSSPRNISSHPTEF